MESSLPAPTARVCRIAASLSSTPPELVEMVIDKLELSRVLELSSAPTAGPTLLAAIENCTAWAWLFRRSCGPTSAFRRLLTLWTAFHQLASFQRRNVKRNVIPWTYEISFELTPEYARVPIHRGYVNYKPQMFTDTEYRGKRVMDMLESTLLECFLGLLQSLSYNSELAAVCMFLPGAPLDVLSWKETKEAHQQRDYRHYLQHSPPENVFATRADEAVRAAWNLEQVIALLPYLDQAGRMLREAQAAELRSMTATFDRYPDLVKTPPMAPDTPRANKKHIADALRRDASRVMSKPFRHTYWNSDERHYRKEPIVRRETLPTTPEHQGPRRMGWYRFRHPHPTLVPYDWSLRLFKWAIDTHPIQEGGRYPSDLIPDLRRASQDLTFIRRHGIDEPKHRRLVADSTTGQVVGHVFNLLDPDVAQMPSPEPELLWLESFLRCVSWITTELPEPTSWFQGALCLPQNIAAPRPASSPQAEGAVKGGDDDYDDDDAKRKAAPRVLLDEADYRHFIETETPEVIARQLLADGAECRAGAARLPSLLALYMPKFSAARPLAGEVTRHMIPDCHVSVRQLVYDDTLAKIRNWLRNAGASPADDLMPAYGVTLAATADGLPPGPSPSSLPRTPRHTWICYVCHLRSSGPPHRLLPSMCGACGDFNLAGSARSLPRNLDLGGKVAVVTGARVNLGFHTALRLLRCGARVVATSRYPRDAAERYRRERDWEDWGAGGRLRVVGADFRAAGDAFGLVARIKEIISGVHGGDEEGESDGDGWGRLDILINNAAQTLTDSVEAEGKAIQREQRLLLEQNDYGHVLVGQDTYRPRVRGGNAELVLGNDGSGQGQEQAQQKLESSIPATTTMTAEDHPLPFQGELAAPTAPSSWVQSLAEIPYEDVISAHSVNTFVPMILMRELQDLMAKPDEEEGKSAGQRQPRPPAGYIINVSSREGIFEHMHPSSSGHGNAKSGSRHVHTNMSKAGLNMLTETEAAASWRRLRVAVNTVDPGYMSAAPEYEGAHGGERPIGWEDGAGRVLWAVALGEGKKKSQEGEGEEGEEGEGPVVVWGRFLKHYGAVRVDVRVGRG